MAKIKKNSISIAVFDSGVGGLSILGSLQKNMPQVTYYYCFDNYCFPYGLKDNSFLELRVYELIRKFITSYDIDVIVIACNTASMASLDFLRQRIQIPIVGVVPAVKLAAKKSISKVFGVLATESTIKQSYLSNLIDRYCDSNKVIRAASSKLVEIAEKKLYGYSYSLEEIFHAVEPLLKVPKLDTVVLACTHFPHLREELLKIAPHIEWLDSAEAISKRVSFIINSIFESDKVKKNTHNYAFFTASTFALEDKSKKLWMNRFEFSNIQNINI